MSDNPADQAAQLDHVKVFYDGACPSCVKDRRFYERVSGKRSEQVEWFDITGQEAELCKLGIDPQQAMKELHVQKEDGSIISELDAYIELMRRTLWLRPLAFLIGLPLIRPALAKLYHWMVTRRLTRTGRL